MKRLSLAFAAIALVTALTACGSGVADSDSINDADTGDSASEDGFVKPDGVHPDVALPDGLDAQPSDADVSLPDGVPPDGLDATDVPDVNPACQPPYAGFGCACASGDDCASGYCVETNQGKACTIPCDGTCEAAGWTCAEVKDTCPDCIYICVFQSVSLCTPCDTDADCGSSDAALDARCVSYGPAGSFCGSPCTGDAECPGGYACDDVPLPGGASTKQCVLQEGLCPCSPRAIANAASTSCLVQNQFGECAGTRACSSQGLTACDGATPMAETCNDQDDDCDGAVDEDVAPQSCEITNQFGTCPGQKTCDAGAWTCTGTAPADETCNGVDDDCDGLTDNAFGDLDADGLADCVDPDDDGDGVLDDGNQSGTIGDAPCPEGQTAGCDDNCTNVANATQADLDKDGKGNGCDCDADGDNYLSTAPGCDGDDCFDLDKTRHPGVVEEPVAGDPCRWCNGIDDNCNGSTDEACPDADGDGTVDCVDPDDDNDGVPDVADNCPFVANQGQANLDGDESGDACDPDADGDDVANEADNCPFTPNGDQLDSDGDGDGDACDGDRDGDQDPDETDCGPTDPEVHHGADEVCNGKDDDCDTLIDADDVGTETGCEGEGCNVPLQIVACDLQAGLCAGCMKRADQCLYGEWLPCAATDYVACDENYEVQETYCDSKDNDCNGTTDEGHTVLDWNGETRQLGEGCGTGACAGGIAVCQPLWWGALCSSDELAEPETCNGRDDDCDGLTDEDFLYTNWNGTARKVGESCGTGACADGVVVCQPDALGVLCTTAGLSAPETCNLVDDDCDGKTDAQDADLPAHDAPLCEKQAGVCQGSRKAPALCVGGTWLACGELDYVAYTLAYQHGSEVACDAADNDCDAQVDEGFTYTDWNGLVRKLAEPCGTGACAGGVVQCHGDAETWCSTIESAAPEACNGADDDCDGLIDEGFTLTDWNGAVRSIGEGCGTGICEGGTVVCDPGANAAVCATIPGEPERCNGVDDDCDGLTDEGFTFTDWNGQVRALHAACGTGACANGEVVCTVDGAATACDTAGLAGVETCNGSDDDCDGKVDANDPDLLTNDHPICENGNGVCAGCAKPASLCAGGTWLPCGTTEYAACSGSYHAGAETLCDGLDDNCSGAADEAFLLSDWNSTVRGIGQGCGTGACAGGTVVCDPFQSAAMCSTASMAGPEFCNGFDDDCDGTADEGFLLSDWNGAQRGVGQGCGTGACAGGTVVCDVPNNKAVCTSAGNAGAESCDGTDNNCNGSIDEGYTLTDWNGQVRALHAACGTGACANGEVVCNASHTGTTCDTAGNADVEVCNGADDDCDGKVDANDPDLLAHDQPACELQAGVCSGCLKPAALCSGGTWQACGTAQYSACNPLYQAGSETLCDSFDNDCSGQADEDFGNDVNNCGACGTKCTNEHGGTACVNSVCKPDCAGGFKSCDGWANNGCEQSLRTNDNCGDCGVACNLTNAVESCSTGLCEVTSCNAGFCNNDGINSTGCEYTLDTNPTCGGAVQSLGTVYGDNPSTNAETYSFGEKWLRVRVEENNSDAFARHPETATISLYSPGTANYDLEAFCDNCTTTAGSSFNGAGSADTVNVRWDEGCTLVFGVCTGLPDGVDSSRDVYIRVRYANANTCDQWHLVVQGNTSVGSNTCSQK